MSQTLSAPTSVPPGSTVNFCDGTTGTVSAAGTIVCPDACVTTLLDAGFEYAATDAGSISNAVSASQSSATSGGLTGSVSTSAATSGGLADSVTRSAAGSGGQAASTAQSAGVSAGASASVARSSITSGSV